MLINIEVLNTLLKLLLAWNSEALIFSNEGWTKKQANFKLPLFQFFLIFLWQTEKLWLDTKIIVVKQVDLEPTQKCILSQKYHPGMNVMNGNKEDYKRINCRQFSPDIWRHIFASWHFFYRQLDFKSEPGVANEMLENEPKSCLTVAYFYSWFLHDLEKISCFEKCNLRQGSC